MTDLALTIAGSEATGGAGAQADLKTFQARGVFGITALTCIVSFDPAHDWGHRFVPVAPEVIADQLEAITATYGPDQLDTVKIGMLGTVPTIEVVSQFLAEKKFTNVIVDPVLICKGQELGAALDTDQALKEKILPYATVVTPNHFEAIQLSGLSDISNVDDLTAAAQKIHETHGAVVVAKGGVRLTGPDAVDVFFDGDRLEVLSEPKVGEHAVSGAGCSLAAAITAEIARGKSAYDAAALAKDFVTEGIKNRISSRAPFDALRQLNESI